MTAITCTRRLTFCAGHRVAGHEGKCRFLHGHNYVVYIEARAEPGFEGLDGIGRVIDFSVLKERFGTWIDQNWDHKFLAWAGDDELRDFWHEPATHKAEKLWPVFWLDYNPTAENIGRVLMELAPDLMQGTNVRIVSVRVEETENCSAHVF